MTSSCTKPWRSLLTDPHKNTTNMKKNVFVLAFLALAWTSCTEFSDMGMKNPPENAKIIGPQDRESAEGSLLIKLTDEAAANLKDGTFNLESILKEIGNATAEPLFHVTAGKEAAAAKHNLDKWYAIGFDPDVSVVQAAGILASYPQIKAIQYNTLIEPPLSPLTAEYDPVITRSGKNPSGPFNDPNLPMQWNLINTGDKSISETAIEGADVGVKDAWRLTAGDPRIIVAVLDQGVSVTHPDLNGSLWINPAEYNGTDGADDDGNGYKDDKHGYNFAENKGKPSAKYGADHGTHVAGTIAAVNNNGIGVSSIAGGSGNGDGVRIMSLQIFDTKGGKTSMANVAKAYHYAADHGASIVQCSFGESEDTFRSDSEYAAEHTAEYDALMYFLNPANANCEAIETNIAVFASGNYNKPASLFPGALSGCLAVTAICPDYLPGGYSNYGAGCDIAAPGGDIVEGDNNAPCMILSTGYGQQGDFSYVYKYGTSMACPHVSGVVALGMSYALKIGKKFSREDFLSRLLTSSEDIDMYMTPGLTKLYYDSSAKSYVDVDITAKKNLMGAGTVNAWKFLMALEGTPTYITVPGKKLSINLSGYFGKVAADRFSLEMDDASKASLGITAAPTVNEGVLEITCTKTGSGKIRLTSNVGKDGDISGLDFHQDISIVSRPSVAENGGWL